MNSTTRSVLITGCSSGIGRDAAFTLAERGWRVFATCRKSADCAELQREGLESFQLDYESSSSIQAAVQESLRRTDGSLDAIFNNGAHGWVGAVEDTPTEALRALFEVNFFGYHELVRLVIPVMRRQGQGRIVNNSSILGFVTMPWRGAYNSAKFALEGLSDTMRIELHGTGIHVSLIQPGPITTRIRENTRVHFEKWVDWESSAMSDQYRTKLLPRLYGDAVSKDKYELPPSAVTKRLIHALESPRPHVRYHVTFPTAFMSVMKRILTSRAVDRIMMSS